MAEELKSAAQDQWEDLAQAIRVHLAKMAELLPAMNPSEVSSFVKTVDDAMWLEVKANGFDQQMESWRRTHERESAFGG